MDPSTQSAHGPQAHCDYTHLCTPDGHRHFWGAVVMDGGAILARLAGQLPDHVNGSVMGERLGLLCAQEAVRRHAQTLGLEGQALAWSTDATASAGLLEASWRSRAELLAQLAHHAAGELAGRYRSHLETTGQHPASVQVLVEAPAPTAAVGGGLTLPTFLSGTDTSSPARLWLLRVWHDRLRALEAAQKRGCAVAAEACRKRLDELLQGDPLVGAAWADAEAKKPQQAGWLRKTLQKLESGTAGPQYTLAGLSLPQTALDRARATPLMLVTFSAPWMDEQIDLCAQRALLRRVHKGARMIRELPGGDQLPSWEQLEELLEDLDDLPTSVLLMAIERRTERAQQRPTLASHSRLYAPAPPPASHPGAQRGYAGTGRLKVRVHVRGHSVQAPTPASLTAGPGAQA